MHKFALSLLLVLSACTAREVTPQTPAQAPAQAPAVAPDASGKAGTLARIHALVGKASCAGDGECRSLPLGTRPCGGPESYLAFSNTQTPEAQLRALGQAYADERRKANTESGLVSTCLFKPDPGAVCKAGTCQLGTIQPVSVQ